MTSRSPATRRCVLADLGVREDNLDEAVERALQQQYPNPRPLERDALRALLDDAFHGRRPTA